MPPSGRRRRRSIDRYDESESARDSSERPSLDAQFELPRRQSRSHSGRYQEQSGSTRRSRSRGGMEQIERSLASRSHEAAGPYARLRTPPPQAQSPEPQHSGPHRPAHQLEVDDSATRPHAAGPSRSRRAVHWWNRHVGHSRSLTWLTLIFIIVGIIGLVVLATWIVFLILDRIAEANA